MLEIIYEDEDLIAINKPHGLLVHRSSIARDADEFAIQLLRDQIGQKVYPVHRIDRKTSGILLFAKNEEMNSRIQVMFMNNEIRKKYIAIVRGFTPEEGEIDYPLKNENGKSLEAKTNYRLIEKFEIDLPNGKHATSRYSLIEVTPESGRMHQIRRHMAHVFHPIIGDRPHGCNKQNKLLLEAFGLKEMMLHACELNFLHPRTRLNTTIKANVSEVFSQILCHFGIQQSDCSMK